MPKPNIVVLDGYTLNPGDLTWDGLKALGNLVVYPRTKQEDVFKRSKGAHLIFVNKVVLDAETLRKLSPTLKFVGLLATGYNVVDVAECRRLNIMVSNIPSYGTTSVTQSVFSHILNITNAVAQHSKGVKEEGKWVKAPDWCYWDTNLIELKDRTLGIIGFGRIGQQTARVALAFDMKVVAFDTYVKKSPVPGVEMLALAQLCRQSDMITLHCFLTPENTGMVNTALLSTMKKNCILVNTSRGQLIKDADLADALNQGVIAGAGLDVVEVEPPLASNPLFKAKNCFITPHISWATHESRERLMNFAADNASRFLAGKPINDVRPKL